MEAIELEIVDAHVAAVTHAEVELHAALVDLVVESEVVLGAQQRAGRGLVRIEPDLGDHRGGEVGATHVEVVGQRARDLERFGLEYLARLEHRLGLGGTRFVVDRLLGVLAHDGAARAQQTQHKDEPKAH